MAKIISITDNEIRFDNGCTITYDHIQDCCETNYADFYQLDDLARGADFDTDNMIFQRDEYGFRFGSGNTHMFFVPCYSEQNGYYTTHIDIYFNGDEVLHYVCCDLVLC